MSRPAGGTAASPAPTTLLMVRGRAHEVRMWARQGLLPVWVVPGLAWTLVVPAGEPVAAAPYDDPTTVLGGRPVPARLRPAVCLMVDGPRAVLAVQQRSRRASQRWLVWGEGTGLARVDVLPLVSMSTLAEVLGVRGAGGAHLLREVLAPDGRRAAEVVDDIVRVAGLPGAGLVVGVGAAGDLPDAARVDPAPEVVERFDDFVSREARLNAEFEETT